jgi:chromosome partitioning protein
MPGKVITVAQQKGGSGKTTLTANLALALAAKNLTVAILDTDPQGSLGRWFMARMERLGDAEPGLDFRTASAWGARYEARQLIRDHDLVIIDTPPKMGLDGKPAIEVSDLVIVPISPSPVDVWATEPTIELARADGKPVLIVLNRAALRTRLTGEIREAVGKMGCDVAETMIGNRVIYAESAGTGHGAIERRPSGPAAAEISMLADEVTQRLGD